MINNLNIIVLCIVNMNLNMFLTKTILLILS